MNLPFTTDEFLQVFASYNTEVWPMQVIFYLLAAAALVFSVRKFPASDGTVSSILALLWIWMGIVYHILFFSSINPAAYLFGGLFVVQGLVFIYAGVIRKSLTFRFRRDEFGLTGVLLLLYALIIYPILGYFNGHIYPQSPTFGLPCPTTIFTFGLLLWTDGKIPWWVPAIPLLWSALGFSAALNLGITEDIGLLVAGGLTASLLIIRNHKKQGTDHDGVRLTSLRG